MNETIKFETGKEYTMRSPSDSNCVWTYKVTRRTEKSIWVEDFPHKDKRMVVNAYNGVEYVKPLGYYSMAPTLRASNKLA